MAQKTPVCDYEGSDYRTRFWDDQGRDYEDQVERIALRRLLPPQGHTLIDIGAGFGRLADEFAGYRQVVLFDYSRSLLREAQARLAGDDRFLYVAGDWYQMPFVAGLFETMVQVRSIHHAASVPALFQEVARISRPSAVYVLEFANKHNLKAILRYWFGRQKWSPFSLEPAEFIDLNFDFHPRWMRRQLQSAGLRPGRTLAVSYYRLALLKRLLPARWLATFDSLAQPTGKWWQLSPSVFVRCRNSTGGLLAQPGTFFACPVCRTPLGTVAGSQIVCPKSGCGRRWRYDDGLYDFKEPA